MIDKKNSRSGFTLVELLIVIAVIGFLTAVLALTFSAVTRISSTSMSQNIVLSQVQMAGDWISRDILSAENVTAYSSGTRLAMISRYQWNGTDNITKVTVYYDINGNTLTRTVGTGNAQQVAQFISPIGSGTSLAASTAASENKTYILTVQSVYNNSNFSRVYKVSQRIQ